MAKRSRWNPDGYLPRERRWPDGRFLCVFLPSELQWTRCIYALCDPEHRGRVRYIGATRGSVFARVGRHLRDAELRLAPHWRGDPKPTPLARWLMNLLRAGTFPRLGILEIADPDAELFTLEAQWIAQYRDQGEADLNDPRPAKVRTFSEPRSEMAGRKNAKA